MSSTKLPEPRSTAALMIDSDRAARFSCRAPIARGVKPREMMPRTLVWSGGSMLISITRCASTWSRVMSGANRMIAPFSAVEKSLLFFDTAATSACLLTAQ